MTSGKTDRRVRKTRKLLIEGLTQLLKEKSINEISVRELSDLVDINRGTFYLHYKDIFDMLTQIENDLFKELDTLFSSHSVEELKSSPLPIFKDIFRFAKTNSELFQIFLGPNGDSAFVNRTKELVRRHCYNNWQMISAPVIPQGLPIFIPLSYQGGLACSQIGLTRVCRSPSMKWPRSLNRLFSAGLIL